MYLPGDETRQRKRCFLAKPLEGLAELEASAEVLVGWLNKCQGLEDRDLSFSYGVEIKENLKRDQGRFGRRSPSSRFSSLTRFHAFHCTLLVDAAPGAVAGLPVLDLRLCQRGRYRIYADLYLPGFQQRRAEHCRWHRNVHRLYDWLLCLWRDCRAMPAQRQSMASLSVSSSPAWGLFCSRLRAT